MFELLSIGGLAVSVSILYYLLETEINKAITNNKSN